MAETHTANAPQIPTAPPVRTTGQGAAPAAAPVAKEATTAPAPAPAAAQAAVTAPHEEPSLLDAVPAEAKKFAGKYESVEELEKGYAEAQKKLSERAPSVPEKYELHKAFADMGMQVADPTEHAEAYAKAEGELRDAGVTAEQLPKLLAMNKASIENAIQAYAAANPVVRNDIKAERTKLEQAWGPQTDANLSALGQYAKNLPQHVAKTLAQTAEGAQWLFDLMSSKNSPIPMRNNPVEAINPVKINEEIKNIMTSPAYRNRHHPDYNSANKRVDQLLAQKAANR